MTDQSIDTTKVQFDEIMSIIGVPHGNMDVGLLVRAEMTQKQEYRQYPLQHRWQLTKLGNLEHSAQSAGLSAGWRVSFLVSLV